MKEYEKNIVEETFVVSEIDGSAIWLSGCYAYLLAYPNKLYK